MRWRSMMVMTCLALAGLIAGCHGGGGQGTTAVTIAVGSGKAAHKALRPAVLSKATPTIASVTFTITGPGMSTVVRTVPVTPPRTVTEVFYLDNGPDRTFLIEAMDGTSAVVYRGSSTATLDGTPVTITLPLQNLLFNRLLGSAWGDQAKAIARDGNGDIIIVGLTYGDLEGNANADPTHGTYDLFVTKLTPTGTRIWTRQFGTAADDDAYSVATDAGGYIYVAGATNGDLNQQPRSGTTDAYVMKLNPAGTELWTRLTGTAGTATAGNAIAVDAAGNAYMTGYTTGGLDGNVNTGSFDMFVTKFTTTGLWQWTVQRGSAGEDGGWGIALDAGGNNVYVAGQTFGGLDGNTNADASGNTSDLFLMRFDAAGAWAWTQQLGTPSDDDAWAVAVDPATGTVYVAGGTQGDFGGTNLGLYDLFLLKFDPAGTVAPNYPDLRGSAGIDIANAVTVDPSGMVVVTGVTSGAFDGIEGDGLNDLIVVKYDASGATPVRLWSQEFGTHADDNGVGVVTGPTGTITVVGNTFGSQTSSATEDVFLLQYDGTGTRIP